MGNLFGVYVPPTFNSIHWKDWKAVIDLTTCQICRNQHGQIYKIEDSPNPKPPLHIYCRCTVKPMNSAIAGIGTKNGNDGADFWLKYYQILPNYYITASDISSLGWVPGKFPSDFAPGKMITKGIYNNRNGHLPEKYGRTWYEADINYESGFRNSSRILWSNDGLIFVTYDHYKSFIEIT